MSALMGGVKAEANKKSAPTNAKAEVIPFMVPKCSKLIEAFSSPQRTRCSAKRTVKLPLPSYVCVFCGRPTHQQPQPRRLLQKQKLIQLRLEKLLR
jgi:hypothetical protein